MKKQLSEKTGQSGGGGAPASGPSSILHPPSSDLDYAERAGAMERSARQALVAQAGQRLAKATAMGHSVGSMEMMLVNHLREAGLLLNQASGREQLKFTGEGMEFVRRELLPLLPEGTRMETVKMVVHLAAVLPKPVETLEELRAAKREAQLFFQLHGLEDGPRAREAQIAHAKNFFAEFASGFESLRAKLQNLTEAAPMETWPADQLDQFIDTTAPVKARYDEAVRLRAQARL